MMCPLVDIDGVIRGSGNRTTVDYNVTIVTYPDTMFPGVSQPYMPDDNIVGIYYKHSLCVKAGGI